MTSVQQLLEELGKRPEAKDLLKECGMKGTPQDYAEAVLSVAQRLGIETQVGAAELVAHLEKRDASRRAATDQVAKGIVALDDDELERVAGGVYYKKCDKYYGGCQNLTDDVLYIEGCWWDFVEGTECTVFDGCDNIYVGYYDCNSKYN